MTPLFLVRWKLRRLGYRLHRSHCAHKPRCYFIDTADGRHTATGMTRTEVRAHAVAQMEEHRRAQQRIQGASGIR